MICQSGVGNKDVVPLLIPIDCRRHKEAHENNKYVFHIHWTNSLYFNSPGSRGHICCFIPSYF